MWGAGGMNVFQAVRYCALALLAPLLSASPHLLPASPQAADAQNSVLMDNAAAALLLDMRLHSHVRRVALVGGGGTVA